MKKIKIFGLMLGLFISIQAFGQTKTISLKTELLTNPIGIDVKNPRLSWQIESNERGVIQIAYHVLVASTKEKLNENIGDVWDSKKVNSENSINVIYQGKELTSRSEYFWKVKTYTNRGESNWSATSSWEMGLLNYKDWSARWIGFDKYFASDNEEAGKLSARYFRKDFSTTKKVKTARAYIMGLGLYELYIDGKKVGDQVLAPTPTDYTQNIKYNVLDVTNFLTTGNHTIGVVLGNGRFYAMRQAKPYKVKTFGFPKMQLQLFVNYTDGTSEVIKSDDSWKGTTNGPITANNEYDGEEYDARKELLGWANYGYNAKDWLTAQFVQEPGGNYEAQLNNNMKVMQNIAVTNIIKKGEGKYIVDFGQNFSGWVKIKVKGAKGTKVILRFAESLEENGELFTTNLRDAKATDTYILKGEGEEEWEPKFTYHGFRYVEVSGYPGTLTKENLIGRFVYDEMQNVGTFSSSNSLLNQIHKNAWWGIASNYKGIPIDCPQRNERQPWLGDRPVSAYGENFLFDNANLYIKWLDDIKLSQKEDGAIPDVAPAFWRYYSDNISWPGTYLFIADMLYQQTGDIRVLEKHYPAMKKWMDYMQSRYKNSEGIITKDSYGDWCFPPITIEEGRGKIADKKYPSALISTSYYYHLLNTMARFSELTGNQKDKSYFVDFAAQIRKDFNKKYYNAAGFYGSNSLTDNLLAMYFGLVEDTNKEKLAHRIIEIVEKENKGHLSTGVIGTQWIMRTITNLGRTDLAYKLATKTTYPSWGYMIENGATTIWELWNGNTAHPKMNSQNHVMMLGDLLIWYYENLAGIKSAEAGFKTIEMKPEIIEGLNFVNASYQTLYGEVKSSWTKSKNAFDWKISIPVNTKAKVYLPVKDVASVTESNKKLLSSKDFKILGLEKGKVLVEIGSGNYQFKTKL